MKLYQSKAKQYNRLKLRKMNLNFSNCDIYLSRLFSAFCLFLILAEANVWLDPMNNTLLVLGYRLFILLTPLFFLLFKHKLTFIAFAIAELGLIFWFNHLAVPGTICFAIGISISGYMLKYYSSFTTHGAAGNKIALNVGSIISGVVVVLTQNIYAILIVCVCVLLISFISFTKYFHRETISKFNSAKSHFMFTGLLSKSGLAWAIIGFVIGVKLIAIVSILPQFLINSNNGKLPAWFGAMLILNSIIVVIFQLPIMKIIKSISKRAAITPLFLGMAIICLSSFIGINSFWDAFFWTLSLSVIECTISYLDKLSQDEGLLLIKEATVGIGSAATVILVRYFNPEEGSFIIGILSMVLLMLSIFIFTRMSKESYAYVSD